jgi:hypothetical protein
MLAKGPKRVSQRISGALGDAFAAMTLSSSVRVGIAGPVGAGKTSLATTLEIALNRIVPCWSEGVKKMSKTYAVRGDESYDQHDGTLMKPYEERAVLGDEDGRQLVLCDMPGIRDAVGEADEFAGHLADERRTKDRSLVADWGFTLQNKADAYTGRGAQTPDVVLLVFEGEKLSNMPDKEAALLLKPYAAFMGKVRAALNKPRLPFLVVVTKTDKIDSNKAEGARAQVKRRISTALAGDVPDIHLVHNYTRAELQEEFTEITNRASTAGMLFHNKVAAKDKYDKMIDGCVKRTSAHLYLARCTLNAVLKADSL